MPKTIKYTGTRERWPELATTGKQSVWMPGQTEERSDTEASQLIATGQFIEVFALDDLPLSSLVSGGGISGLAVGAGSAVANTALLQAAITAGGVVSIPGNLGTIQVNATLYIGSNTTVLIGKGTTLKMADGSARTLVLANLNDQTGNTNIYVGGGGTIDGNTLNQSGASDVRLMGLYFCNVDGLTIENLRIVNIRKYHILLASATNFLVRDIWVTSTQAGADGVHVHGNSNNGVIERIGGLSGDDFIALNVKDVSNWLNPTTPALHIGPIRNITVRKITGNVQAGNAGNCVAVYSNVTGTTTNLTGATWANGVGTFTFSGTVGTVGDFVQIAGVNPSTWNGNYRVLSAGAGSTVVELDQNPGTYVSGGTIDSNYAMTGIRIEDVKPVMVNGGTVVYLATFPSPGFGGVINDVVVDDIRPQSTTGRTLSFYTNIGLGQFSRIRHGLQSGSGTELIWGEQGFNHEVLMFDRIANDMPYTASLGALVKINSPARRIKISNVNNQLAGSTTSAWLLTNSASSTTLQFESVELDNFSANARRDNGGRAGLELGQGQFPAVSIANMWVANCGNAVTGNGSTGDVNLVIDGLQVKNIFGGNSVLQFYANGARVQISMQGYLPRGNAYGAYNVLSSTGTGGAVTMLKSSGAPNYTYTFPWIASDTPGSGSSLYCDGHEIAVDVTKLARWDGAIVRNTNAAAGTLGVAGLVSCQGTAANSWSLLSDPTKKY